MKPGSAGVAARQGGGFRQGFGHFDEEHLEQNAGTSAVQQKQLTQQTTQNTTPAAGQAGSQPAHGQVKPQTHKPTPPREVSTIKDELVDRPTKDIVQGLKSIFSLNDILGINPGDTPEEQEHKKKVSENFEKLTEEQQAVAKKRFQQEMQKNKQAEDEKAKKEQAKAQAKAQDIAPPSSPQKGPVGPGGGSMSRKKTAQQMLERDRQSIGRVAGAN